MSDFITMCLSGEAHPEEIDEFVNQWHDSGSDLPIHEYLGMTRDEYLSWVRDPDVLPDIVRARDIEPVATR